MASTFPCVRASRVASKAIIPAARILYEIPQCANVSPQALDTLVCFFPQFPQALLHALFPILPHNERAKMSPAGCIRKWVRSLDCARKLAYSFPDFVDTGCVFR